jgi:hypothetical protein
MTPTAVENDGSADGATIRTVGAFTSVTRTATVADVVFPAVSRAVTVRVLMPGVSAIEFTDHADVPTAAPLPPWLFDQVTSARATSSLATPPSITTLSLVW